MECLTVKIKTKCHSNRGLLQIHYDKSSHQRQEHLLLHFTTTNYYYNICVVRFGPFGVPSQKNLILILIPFDEGEGSGLYICAN